MIKEWHTRIIWFTGLPSLVRGLPNSVTMSMNRPNVVIFLQVGWALIVVMMFASY